MAIFSGVSNGLLKAYLQNKSTPKKMNEAIEAIEAIWDMLSRKETTGEEQ